MDYLGLVFTDHAIKRMAERGLDRNQALEILRNPDSKENERGTIRLKKKFNGFDATLLLKQNNRKEWIVISFWRDPPLPGTKDDRNRKNWEKYKKAGFWGKILISVRQQLGL